MVESNAKAKEVPPLSLIIPEDEVSEEYDSTKCASFKLLTSPGAVTAAGGAPPTKYSFTMLKVDGTQSIREHIKWYNNVLKVFAGLNVTGPTDRKRMTEELCTGAALTAYSAGVENSNMNRWEVAKVQTRANTPRNPARAAVAARRAVAAVAANPAAVPPVAAVMAQPAMPAMPAMPEETIAEWQARVNLAVNATPRSPVDETDLLQGMAAVLIAICPYKVLEKQKTFMRRKMRKPFDLTTRQYVNHLTRINETELTVLPPFRIGQAFSQEEFKEIILYGIPNSWRKDMDKFDFDPYVCTVQQLVEFCERMESADEQARHGDKSVEKSSGSGSSSKKKSKSYSRFDKKDSNCKEGGKWCDYHETTTHNTKDCQTIKKLKASKSSDGTKEKKQWKSKSDYAKDKAK